MRGNGSSVKMRPAQTGVIKSGCWGARSSRSHPVGVPPTGAGLNTIHLSVSHRKTSDFFGGTPKAAGEDARDPHLSFMDAT
jgi:hypothetical protein